MPSSSIIGSRRKPYPSDLTDEQWLVLEPMIPPEKHGGRHREVDMREVVNAILYVLRTGCPWRHLPHDFPPYGTVWWYFWLWCNDGTWTRIHDRLREMVRVKAGKDPQPSAAIIDSQSVKTTEQGGPRGYDAAKKVTGRKRHIVVDTLCLILAVTVHSADIQDRDGAKLPLEKIAAVMLSYFSRLQVIFADSGYTGQLTGWLAQFFQSKVRLEIVRKLEGQHTFTVLQWRWIVERTFGWLGRYRRHYKGQRSLYQDLLKKDVLAILEFETQPIAALKSAGIEKASLVVVAHVNDPDNMLFILSARKIRPDIRIISVVHDSALIETAKNAGADMVVPASVTVGHLLALSAVSKDLVGIVFSEKIGTREIAQFSIFKSSPLIERGLQEVGKYASVIGVVRGNDVVRNLFEQGLGKPGVHPQSWWKGFPRALVKPDERPARKGSMYGVFPPPAQFIPKTLVHKAILSEEPLDWYGSTTIWCSTEDQFKKYTYPIPKEEGGAEIHMIWSDSPCRTTCWNGGNETVEAHRNPKIETIVVQHPWLENDALFSDIILPVSTKLEEQDFGIDRDSQYFSVFLEEKSIEPIGESKSDYEITCEVAKKLGVYDEYTKGKSIEDWIKFAYENSGVEKLVSWEDLNRAWDSAEMGKWFE